MRSQFPRPLRSALILALGAAALGTGATVVGCSDAVAKARPASEVASAPAITRPPTAVAATAPLAEVVTPQAVVRPPGIGALENPAALRRFYEALARLEDGKAQGDVKVVHFGDSHTAADYETGAVRRSLQQKFGDGGRGFVALGQPWKKYVQDGVRTGMTKEWQPERGKLVAGKVVGDGCYGLGGVCLLTQKKGARAWTEVSAQASKVEVAYLEQPEGGSFDLFIDGSRTMRLSTKGQAVSSAFKLVDVQEGPHNVEVRTVGDGDVRVFGVSLDRTQAGVVYDALGINGARASIALSWNEQHMAEQLKHRAPDLVVLAYGTNESGDETTAQTYERQIVDVLGRISRAVPNSACLLLGPPDRAVETKDGWMTSPKLVEVMAVQRRVAEAAGCAYYSQFDAMGGDGTIASWALEDPPRAGKDRVHLSKDGYTQLGTTFASDLLRGYASYRAERGKPAVANR